MYVTNDDFDFFSVNGKEIDTDDPDFASWLVLHFREHISQAEAETDCGTKSKERGMK